MDNPAIRVGIYRPRRCGALLALVAVLGWSAGCGGANRPRTIPVSGKITFDQAPPPAEGVIYFSPVESTDGVARRPGRGPFGKDGAYRVGSFEQDDGLAPGTYRVRVECWKRRSGYTDDPGESYVPADYQPENLVVPADESEVVLNIDVPSAG